MTIIQNSLLLDQAQWDIVLDVNGNIALASAPYSIAQDVASAVRTFVGECWYDNSLGLPYWQNILGKFPPLQFVDQKICLLYTSPSPRDRQKSRMPSSA